MVVEEKLAALSMCYSITSDANIMEENTASVLRKNVTAGSS